MLSKKSRVTTAHATVVALAAGALAVQQMLPASAAVSPAPPARAAAAAPNLIQGVVVDQDGRPVDDVVVEAVRADGSTQATALTYASDREDGPQHGYFFVEVPRGSYVLTLSREGYKSVDYDAGQITKRRKTISMGELEIEKIGAPTTTSATLDEATITTRENGSMTVTVTSKAGKVVGDVEVREGRSVVGEATIGKKAKGTVVVTLDRLPKGSHQLTAHFVGTADHKPSSSKQLTLTVVKKKR